MMLGVTCVGWPLDPDCSGRPMAIISYSRLNSLSLLIHTVVTVDHTIYREIAFMLLQQTDRVCDC